MLVSKLPDKTSDNIASEFGEKVAKGVKALTKNEEIEYNKQIEDVVQRIKQEPKEVAIVKMADRLFNLRDRVPNWSDEKQAHYLQDATIILNELSYASKNLSEALKNAIEKAKTF